MSSRNSTPVLVVCSMSQRRLRLHGWDYLKQTFTVSATEHVLMTLNHLVTNTVAVKLPVGSFLVSILLPCVHEETSQAYRCCARYNKSVDLNLSSHLDMRQQAK